MKNTAEGAKATEAASPEQQQERESLDDCVKRAQLEKLKAETKNLAAPWWKTADVWSKVLIAFIGIAGAGLALYYQIPQTQVKQHEVMRDLAKKEQQLRETQSSLVETQLTRDRLAAEVAKFQQEAAKFQKPFTDSKFESATTADPSSAQNATTALPKFESPVAAKSSSMQSPTLALPKFESPVAAKSSSMQSPTLALPKFGSTSAAKTSTAQSATLAEFAKPRVFVQFAGDIARGLVDEFRASLAKLDFAVPAAERIEGPDRTEIRYFVTSDSPDIAAQQRKIAEETLKVTTAFFAQKNCPIDDAVVRKIVSKRTSPVEVWIRHNCKTTQPISAN
jgi:hypothetical protein